MYIEIMQFSKSSSSRYLALKHVTLLSRENSCYDNIFDESLSYYSNT